MADTCQTCGSPSHLGCTCICADIRSPDAYVPPACIDDARRVLAGQDPDAARQAEQRWPARVWRAALKIVINEQQEAA